MFYLEETCGICGNGVIGFYRCSDGKTIAFVCTECGTVWDDHRVKEVKPVQFLNTTDLPLPGHECSMGGEISGWATKSEIEAANLGEFIAGEGEA